MSRVLEHKQNMMSKKIAFENEKWSLKGVSKVLSYHVCILDAETEIEHLLEFL